MTRNAIRHVQTHRSRFQPVHVQAGPPQPLPFIALGAAIGVLGAVLALM